MAEVKSVPEGSVNVGSVYENSFGTLRSNTMYAGYKYEAKSNNDRRGMLNEKLQAGLKAFTTSAGGAGTAGFGMIPVFVDPQIVDQTRKFTPLVEIFPRVTNQGMTADFNVITAKGGGFVAAEDAALAETDTTFSRQSNAIKFLYAVGRVTGPSQAATPSYMLQGFQPNAGTPTGVFGNQAAPNAMQLEVLVKARELKELEENLFVNGNVTTDANEFDGIVKIMGTTNVLDKASTAISLDDINTSVQAAFDDGGRPNLAICASSVYTDVLNLLNAKVGLLQPAQQVFWGFSTVVLNTMVGQMPLVPSMFLTNTTNAKQMFFLDLSVWEIRVLQDMTFEEFAKTNDSRKFMLKEYETMICRAPTFNSFIDNIA